MTRCGKFSLLTIVLLCLLAGACTVHHRSQLKDDRVTRDQWALLDQADAAYAAGRWDRAQRLYSRFLDQTRALLADPWIGGHQWMGVPPRTLVEFEKNPVNPHLGVMRRMGEICRRQGRLDQAEEWFRKGLDLSFRIKSRAEGSPTGGGEPYLIEARFFVAQFYRSLSRVYSAQGKIKRSINALKKAMAIDEQIDNPKFLVLDYNLASRILEEAGYYETGLTYARKCLRIHQTNPDQERVRWVGLDYIRLGRINLEMGNFPAALENYEHAERIFRRHDFPESLAGVKVDAGNALLKLGEYDQALDRFARARDIARNKGYAMIRLDALNGLGLAKSHLGRHRQAAADLGRAERLAAQTGSIKKQWVIHNSLCHVARLQNHHDQAFDHARAALELARKMGSRDMAGNMLMLGEIAFLKGDAAQAAAQLQAAKDILEKTDKPEWEWFYHKLAGRLARDRGDREAAAGHFAKAIARIEEVRSRLKTDSFKTGFVANKITIYQDMVEVLLASGHNARAFGYVERAKARTLVDMLAQSAAGGGGGKMQDLVEKEQKIRRRLQKAAARKERALARAAAEKKKEAAARQTRAIEQLKASHRSLVIRSQAERPEFASVISAETLSSREVRTLLEPEETVLEYFITAEHIHIFVLSASGLRVRTVACPREKLVRRINDFRQAINSLAPRKARAAGTALHSVLIAPVADVIGGRELIVVPHGPLHLLPFAALPDGSSCLLARYPLSYAPSATAWKYCLTRKDPLQFEILALGNPELGDPRFDLPAAEAEVSAIRDLYPEMTAFLRDQATPVNLKQAVAGHDILHFATHGYYNPHYPMNSCLRLAPAGRSDGRLMARDIIGMDLDAELIVLSACETGRGRITTGDEVIGLTRAFLFAGAANIVSTLWPIDDTATARLMREFYRNLAHLPADKALRKAQLDLADQMPPYFWASFLLTGAG